MGAGAEPCSGVSTGTQPKEGSLDVSVDQWVTSVWHSSHIAPSGGIAAGDVGLHTAGTYVCNGMRWQTVDTSHHCTNGSIPEIAKKLVDAAVGLVGRD